MSVNIYDKANDELELVAGRVAEGGGSEEYVPKEQLEATTDDGTVTFYFDCKDGVYGYNTSEERGADTFFPFKSESFPFYFIWDTNGETIRESGQKVFKTKGMTCPNPIYFNGSLSDYTFSILINYDYESLFMGYAFLYTTPDYSGKCIAQANFVTAMYLTADDFIPKEGFTNYVGDLYLKVTFLNYGNVEAYVLIKEMYISKK